MDVPLGTVRWLYGGGHENNEKAMKSACNELKGLACLFQCRIPGLHFPLMTSIHYKGFCVLAISILPIQEKSLVYGSSDGGATCFCEEPVSAWMREAGEKLHLAPHTVCGNTIYGYDSHFLKTQFHTNVGLFRPGDFEVHRGMDGRFYCLDFARLMPPGMVLDRDLKKKNFLPAPFFLGLGVNPFFFTI
jgi:hypothetical protein